MHNYQDISMHNNNYQVPQSNDQASTDGAEQSRVKNLLTVTVTGKDARNCTREYR